jgi:hypothetical protein
MITRSRITSIIPFLLCLMPLVAGDLHSNTPTGSGNTSFQTHNLLERKPEPDCTSLSPGVNSAGCGHVLLPESILQSKGELLQVDPTILRKPLLS